MTDPSPSMPGRVVAIDWGLARLGVAASDPTRTLASPHATLHEKDKGLQIKRAAALVRELEATLVLVGLPLHLDGRESESSAAARKFAAKLATFVLPVPVELVDERLSSVEAGERLAERPGRRAPRAGAGFRDGVLDRAAAAVMLQAWLDALPRPGGGT